MMGESSSFSHHLVHMTNTEVSAQLWFMSALKVTPPPPYNKKISLGSGEHPSSLVDHTVQLYLILHSAGVSSGPDNMNSLAPPATIALEVQNRG